MVKMIKEDSAVNGYVVVREQFLASDGTHKYNDVTFDRTNAALFTEYEDVVDALEVINSNRNVVTDRSKFTIKRFRDIID